MKWLSPLVVLALVAAIEATPAGSTDHNENSLLDIGGQSQFKFAIFLIRSDIPHQSDFPHSQRFH